MSRRPHIVVLGAGPAGLGVAWKLALRDEFDVTVLERNRRVGGNAGSFELGGMRVDYGSHRLHPACAPEILADIREMLGDDLLDRPRHGRIRLRGRWLHFPLKPLDLLSNLPPDFTLGVLGDAVLKPFRGKGDANFAEVLEAGLGRTICRDFYFPYAEKIWGEAPERLDAEQARRRVSASSLGKAFRKVLAAVPGFKPPGAGRFFYPRQGYGRISEAYRDAAVDAGVRLELGATAEALEVEDGRVVAVRARRDGEELHLPADQVLSTIPVTVLARAARPAPPPEVVEAARTMRYRAMILVYLVLATDRFSEWDAHYFPARDVRITRMSEPKNYGLAGTEGRTVLCAELPCGVEERVWKATQGELGRLVVEAMETAGLELDAEVERVEVRRLSQAYPIYDIGYDRHLDGLFAWLDTLDGLVTFGRQGLFVHDNTHHTLAMAYALAGSLRSDASLDRERWAGHLEEFRSFVVVD